MTEPVESFVTAGAMRFRTISWGTGPETVLFLHGLSGVAEVWWPTVENLPPGRRHVALDMRGHGQSYAPAHGYTAQDMANDTRRVIRVLGGPVQLVGHSMGARIALVLAARSPRLLRSAAILDIGPEASKRNIAETVRGIETRPERFAGRTEALAFAFRNRTPTALDERIFLARLAESPDGSLRWRASRSALTQAVSRQRAMSYWKDWRAITLPAMYVHGGASNEVSTAIAERMRTENPRVRFERLEGIGHNIPLIAPGQLAALLQDHWSSTEAGEPQA
jgi:pimeloyl-ACP methyl ester carboxylesterase